MPGKHYQDGAGENDSDQKQKDLFVVTMCTHVTIIAFHNYPTTLSEPPALKYLYIRIICTIEQQA